MKVIVLASSSTRRKSLLRQLGLKFIVIPSLVEEKFNPRLKPRGQAKALSLKKAEAAFERYIEKKNRGSGVIIAADTIVAVDSEVLGKPKDKIEAKKMLKKLSGREHSVITGFSIIDTASKKTLTKSVETKVRFRRLSERDIKEYIGREKILDKAGAYAIQGVGSIFVEKIEGDYFNVVGLPIKALVLELRKFGISVL